MIVIDASIALAWTFEDERTPPVDAVLTRVATAGAIVPPIWPAETANALQTAVRRNRIDSGYRDKAIAGLIGLDVVIDPHASSHVWTSSVALADRHGLTVYDATYLELAIRLALPLATLDRALADAARAAGIETLP